MAIYLLKYKRKNNNKYNTVSFDTRSEARLYWDRMPNSIKRSTLDVYIKEIPFTFNGDMGREFNDSFSSFDEAWDEYNSF